MLRPALSSVLALSLAVLPTHAALAAPAAGDPAPGTTAPAEGDAATGVTQPAEGDATAAEGDGSAEGEPSTDAAGEGDAAEADAGEPEETPEETPEEAPDETPEEVTSPEGPVDIDTPTEPKIGKWPAKGIGMLISGGILVALGGAGLATSIVLTNCPEPANSVGCKNKDNRDFLVPIAASVMTVGVVLLIVGGANAAKYKKWKRSAGAKQALVPTLHRGGAGLGYIARF